MITGRLSYLQGAVSSADFRPTDQHAEVQVILRAQVAEVEARFEALLESDLDEFNRLLQQRVGRVIISQ